MYHSFDRRASLLVDIMIDFMLLSLLKFLLNKFKANIIISENNNTKSSDKFFQIINYGKIILKYYLLNK
jgi:hypothetical protein